VGGGRTAHTTAAVTAIAKRMLNGIDAAMNYTFAKKAQSGRASEGEASK